MNAKAKTVELDEGTAVVAPDLGQNAAIAEDDATINSFLNLMSSAIEATNCSIIIGAAETFLTSELTLDEAKERFVGEDVEQQAATFIVERFVGALCVNIHRGITYGESEIDKAIKQLARARVKLVSNKGDEVVEQYVEGRVRWLAQQRCQQEFRAALMPIAQAAYKKQTGLDWAPAGVPANAPVTGSTGQAALDLLTG